MNKNKKAFIFLPDGVGLRNFAFGKFHEEGIAKDFDITYWNNTDFPISELGFKELPVTGKARPISDIYKRAKIKIALKQNAKIFNNNVYLSYIFPSVVKNLKTALKTIFVNFLVFFYNTQKGLFKINKKLCKLERNSTYYLASKETLLKEKPDVVFLTNQRPLSAVAPILAAKDLGIPTITFIFSWDNLPKATLIVESDYYFVWSEFMKLELLKYYPSIKETQVRVSGTPQFECHFNTIFETKKTFFNKYKLNIDKKYICFSGDDITTSPNDHFYLEDAAKAVRKLNEKGYNLGIIYRKCPVDFSDRHINICNNYKDVIKLINPKWNNLGNSWNQVMPLPEDLELLANTVYHTEMVINVGSSMVFDYFSQYKPCAYLNYNTDKTVNTDWKIDKIYKYIHFKSMPSKNTVLWVNNKKDFESVILKVLSNNFKFESTQKWFKKIASHNPESSSLKIWETIDDILTKDER